MLVLITTLYALYVISFGSSSLLLSSHSDGINFPPHSCLIVVQMVQYVASSSFFSFATISTVGFLPQCLEGMGVKLFCQTVCMLHSCLIGVQMGQYVASSSFFCSVSLPFLLWVFLPECLEGVVVKLSYPTECLALG